MSVIALTGQGDIHLCQRLHLYARADYQSQGCVQRLVLADQQVSMDQLLQNHYPGA